MATRTPTPAQLAARARFAEMARSGALNRKRQIAAKKSGGVKRNPAKKTPAIKWGSYGGDPKTKHAFVDGAEVIIFPIKKSETDFYDAPEWARAIVEIFGDANHDNSQYPVGGVQNGKDNVHGFVADSKKRSSNPAKKTVSQKIRQLVHEGYPQRQAVAVALNEQRAGKVKRNPQAKSVASAYSANFKYCVEAKRSLGSAGSVFEMVAGFNTKTQAQNYIDAILASHPGVTLRIKTHK